MLRRLVKPQLDRKFMPHYREWSCIFSLYIFSHHKQCGSWFNSLPILKQCQFNCKKKKTTTQQKYISKNVSKYCIVHLFSFVDFKFKSFGRFGAKKKKKENISVSLFNQALCIFVWKSNLALSKPVTSESCKKHRHETTHALERGSSSIGTMWTMKTQLIWSSLANNPRHVGLE